MIVKIGVKLEYGWFVGGRRLTDSSPQVNSVGFVAVSMTA